MARPEIAEAAAGAVWATFIVQPDEVFSPQNADEIAEAVLAVVEPMIRADERAKLLTMCDTLEADGGMTSATALWVLDLIRQRLREG